MRKTQEENCPKICKFPNDDDESTVVCGHNSLELRLELENISQYFQKYFLLAGKGYLTSDNIFQHN